MSKRDSPTWTLEDNIKGIRRDIRSLWTLTRSLGLIHQAALNATVSSTSYPNGLSFMNITASQSGWPSTAGTVVTWVGSRGAGQRIFQVFVPKTVSAGGQLSIRTRNSDDTAWTAFFTL